MACVIVGAGFAGWTLALKLMQEQREFVLINPTDYFHLNIASVRAVAAEGWANKSLIPLSLCFGKSFKEGKVVSVRPVENEENAQGYVVLESGEEIPFKYLVIATGTAHKWPIKLVGMDKQEALDEYKAINERVKQAKSIVVIGGGATGVELAAEFAHFHPGKEVTLIHNSNSLVNERITQRSQIKLQDMLSREMGVKLVLNERVSNVDDLPITGPGVVMTDKGTSIQADVLFKSIGLKVSTDAYKDGLASAVTERGMLKVDEYFHVEGYKDIFAIGDCANIDEPRLAAYAVRHGECIAKTILNLDRGKNPVKYKPGMLPFLVVVTIGPEKGFGRTNGDWTIPSFVVKNLKSKDMFTKRFWGELKQKVPS